MVFFLSLSERNYSKFIFIFLPEASAGPLRRVSRLCAGIAVCVELDPLPYESDEEYANPALA